jgi:hypothetical protein
MMISQTKFKRHRIKRIRKLQTKLAKRRREYTKKMTDGYIRSLICRDPILKHKDIPDTMVMLWRKNLTLKRILLKMKKEGTF